MTKKSNKIRGGGLVYSTDQDTMASLFTGIKISGTDQREENQNQNRPGEKRSSDDRVRVWIDRKSRGGKEVTVIEGIQLNPEQLKELATLIKTSCGVGGSAKDGEILIQGNQRDKVVDLLIQQGFKNVKKAGG